ncbi:DUF4126 domain-containing protein [Rhizobium laguerreae]|uniref:DUF4126 domain-containing protein n=1 Tax=Rhizobium laguerreae TaxID=1076926 RepID=UPI001C91323F|nr:DUF4126 domain-containing protein [Rhizobium laguerreae]MBY3417089.1 DUF4126 domain-containing protein [Rhizobium laguerreae]
MMFFLALLIGIVAGSRALIAPSAVAWGAYFSLIAVGATPLAFMGYRLTPWIFTALAVVELVADKLPSTPSRKVPVQFGTRILMGALSGATIGAAGGSLAAGLAVGIMGSAIGTLGGAALRARLARYFGSDRPAALVEDVIAIVLSLAVVVLC